MNPLHLAEIRGARLAWAAVSLTFIVTNAAAALALLVSGSAAAAHPVGPDQASEVDSLVALGGFNAVLVALVALAVIGSATQLVVSSRRGAIARLALAGATPRQVVGTVMTQLAVVSLASAIVGDVVAILSLDRALEYVQSDPATPIIIEPHVSVSMLLLANGGCLLVALLGGLRQSLLASRIPPVEALREASRPARTRVWVVAVKVLLCAAGIAGSLALVADPTLIDERDRMQVVLQVSLLHLVLAGALLSSAAPFTVAWLARAWTAMVPVRSGTWHLARNTVVAKGDRLAKSVVPVMFTVGFLIGMLIMGETLVASLAAGGAPVDDFSSEGLGSLLVLLGLPLAVSISGAVGSLVMMTRQRSAELALDGVLGATPAQRAAIPVLEALIVTITATMLAAVMVAMMLVVPVLHFETVLGGFAVGVPWLVVVQVVGALAAVVVAATALPATPSLRQPAPKVIARLVAD